MIKKETLLDEIKALGAIIYFQQVINFNKSQTDEIKRLEAIIQLPSRTQYKYEIAHVIQRDIGSWWHHRINKGSKHGILEGDAVIFTGIAVVYKTNYYTSRVSLLSNNDFRISACFEGDDRPLFFQGKGVVFGVKLMAT